MDLDRQVYQINDYFQFVYKRMSDSTKRVLHLRDFTNSIAKIFQEFGKKLENAAEGFTNEIMRQESDSDGLILNYQILNNNILKIANFFLVFSATSKQEIQEPLEIFTENYRATNKQLYKRGINYIIQLKKYRNDIKQATQRYIQISKEAQRVKENFDKLYNNEPNRSEYTTLQFKWNNLKEEALQQENKSKELVKDANTLWKLFYEQFPLIIDKIDYNDESRFSFTKTTITNLLKNFTCLNKVIDQDIQTKLQQIQSKMFQERNALLARVQSKSSNFLSKNVREEFVDYDTFKKKEELAKQRQFEELQEQSFPNSLQVSKSQRDIIRCFVTHIIEKEKNLPKIGKSESSEVTWLQSCRVILLQKKSCAIFFVYLFFSKIQRLNNYFLRLPDQKYFELSVVLKLILKSNCDQKSTFLILLYRLLYISCHVKRQQDQQILCSQISEINLLSHQDIWKDLADQILNTDMLRNIKRLYSSNTKAALQLLRPKKKAFFSMIKGIFAKQEKDERTKEQKIIKVIEQLMGLLNNLGLPSDRCADIVLSLARKFKLDEEYTTDLLKKVQNKKDFEIRKNLAEKSLKRQEKIVNKNQWLLGIKLCLPYLSLKDMALNLTMLNRQSRNMLKKQILKTIFYSNQGCHMIKSTLRKKAFLSCLDCQAKSFNDKFRRSQKIDQSSFKELIQLDVSRSLHIHKDSVSHQSLSKLLRVYASLHKETNYCQGMNYLAGYALITFKDQAEAYSFFQKIVDERFKGLFQMQLKSMKIRMYQFQRLISIYLPELSDHFKREVVSTESYLVNWLITIFSSAFQYTLSSAVVDAVWDFFVVDGWKGFFKFVVWFMKKNEKSMLDMSYDRILHFLGSVLKSDFFSGEIIPKGMRGEVRQLKITNSLLLQLEKEYQLFMLNIKLRLKA